MWRVRDYLEGVIEFSKEKVECARIFESRGHKDLCEIVLNSRRWQRFMCFS